MRGYSVFVISDEIHQDIVFEGSTHIPSATAGEYDDMLVTLTAASKTFNLAGLQNSLIIIPDEKIRSRFDDYLTKIRITPSNPMGYIAVESPIAAVRRGLRRADGRSLKITIFCAMRSKSARRRRSSRRLREPI